MLQVIRRSGRRVVHAGAVMAAVCLLATVPAAQAPDVAGVAARSREALLALDRYLETWNSRLPSVWAGSLHYPHVRPGAGPFEVYQDAREYAASVNFEQTGRGLEDGRTVPGRHRPWAATHLVPDARRRDDGGPDDE